MIQEEIKELKLSKEELRKLQLTQLEIFKVIDKICRDNNIKYSLYGGTLLGAVRHKGFISWDDDLDIAMTREEYNKFIKAWNANPVEGYMFQEYENEPEMTRSFGKLRKENTEFYAHDELDKNYHHGIFVDIFPFDKVIDTKYQRFIHLIIGSIYLLYSRGYAPEKNGKAMKCISNFLLKIIPKKYYKNIILKCKKYVTKEVNTDNFYYITYSSFKTINWKLNKSLFNEYVDIDFEDMKAMAFSGIDMYLKNIYGDYMQFPPEDKRKGSHIIVRLKF